METNTALNTSQAGENLAILDSHVIRYMKNIGMLDNCIKNITANKYSFYEKKLASYADSLNKNLSTLDIAIWVVMRVVNKENLKWE
jgi:thermostable 8-oxoguanine DNA glycosylase